MDLTERILVAAQIRTNKKAEQVYFKIMGVPAYMIDRKTKKQKEIDRILVAQSAMNTMYR